MQPANPVIIENQRPGTHAWQLSMPARQREIEGYASSTSINRGERIALYVNTQAATFSVQVFRMGWYQGLGGRLLLTLNPIKGTRQPMPEMDVATGLMDCAWVNPVFIQQEQTQDWQSGIYLVKLTEHAKNYESYIIFAVHDTSRHADLLFQQSVTTYQAYNSWGGKSLYKWGSTENVRACKISFNRPYAANLQNPKAAYGVGAGEFICNLQPHNPTYPISNAGWEINMLRWLEREGYNVAYCTNLDTHSQPSLLKNYKAWLSVGHDEYWSWSMRENLETALANGLHLGFFSANTGYWQVRLEDSPSGQKDRVMVCYKSPTRDPISKTSQARLTTYQWREVPTSRPEAQLVGVMYDADPIDGDIVITLPGHWLLAGTSCLMGTKLTGLLGYEVDCHHHTSPGNLEILAKSPWVKLNDPNSQGIAHISLYKTAQEALVFATGSIQWAWGLDDFNAPQLRSARSNAIAQQMTRNLLQRFTA